jgi:archaellum component FlaC
MISQLLPQFETVVKVVKENNSMLDFENNFKKNNIKTIDPIKVVVDTWREAVTDYPENTKDIQATFSNIMTGTTGVDGVFVDGLETVNTVEGKINKLQQLIEMIKSYDAVIGNANI